MKKEFRANSKRKRKFKRMAVDESPENRKPRVTQTPGSKKKKVRSRYHENEIDIVNILSQKWD